MEFERSGIYQIQVFNNLGALLDQKLMRDSGSVEWTYHLDLGQYFIVVKNIEANSYKSFSLVLR